MLQLAAAVAANVDSNAKLGDLDIRRDLDSHEARTLWPNHDL